MPSSLVYQPLIVLIAWTSWHYQDKGTYLFQPTLKVTQTITSEHVASGVGITRGTGIDHHFLSTWCPGQRSPVMLLYSGASLMVSIMGPSTYLFHKQPLPLHIHQHHLHHASPTHLPWSDRCCSLECSQVAIAIYNHWWYIAVWDIAGITITTYNWLLFCYLNWSSTTNINDMLKNVDFSHLQGTTNNKLQTVNVHQTNIPCLLPCTGS